MRVSCPVLSNKSQGPQCFDAQGSVPAPIAEGSTNHGARGCSLESYVTSVTGVTNKYKYMILKGLYGCSIVRSSTLRGVLQELRVLHVTFSRNDRCRPKLEVGLRQQSANSCLSLRSLREQRGRANDLRAAVIPVMLIRQFTCRNECSKRNSPTTSQWCLNGGIREDFNE